MTKQKSSKKSKADKKNNQPLVPAHWNTTDEDEILRRQLRGAEEPVKIHSLLADQPVFGTFRVVNEAGVGYMVEIRALEEQLNSCGCADYRVNGLGTCKHIEAVLHHLRQNVLKESAAYSAHSDQVEIYLHRQGPTTLRIQWPNRKEGFRDQTIRAALDNYFDSAGHLIAPPLQGLPSIRRAIRLLPAAKQGRIRLSYHLPAWEEQLKRDAERKEDQERFLMDVKSGKRSLDVLKMRLYEYQQEGMLHLAFKERALLADEMGLGKTVQAIGAAELLRRRKNVQRVLVISPTSLKAEWEDQIRKFTNLPTLVIQGGRPQRLHQYRQQSFFYLTNYEQIIRDFKEIQDVLSPDLIILDEAQRVKNWQTKTAESVKRLQSPYCFVLTGTPLENRIDDIYSLVQVLDPTVFGPLFRFNRDFYELNEKGRPAGYKNLPELHRRLRPILLRRRKSEVEGQLPERTINNYFVKMHPEQVNRYQEHEAIVAMLAGRAKNRPLRPEEMKKLQMHLACMRMLCDSPYIMDQECRISPKIDEMRELLPELLSSESNKVIIFSEWEKMLQLVRELLVEQGVDFAWHTGSVPQQKRRGEIMKFKEDPTCRVFLTTDAGATGLNLQMANCVINLDLPWNPARLEQRIARAWRKFQTRSVQVINLVCENSIEHRMLDVLEHKQMLSDAVIDGVGDMENLDQQQGRTSFVEKVNSLMNTQIQPEQPQPDTTASGTPEPTTEPAEVSDPVQATKEDAISQFNEKLHWLQIQEQQSKPSTVLAVVEECDEVTRQSLNTVVETNFKPTGNIPQLEVLDRDTFELLQRLAAQGVIQFTAMAQQPLFASEKLKPAQDEVRKKKLATATKHLEKAQHQHRMAQVLLSSDFVAEAVKPLCTAMEAALEGMAALTETMEPPKPPISLRFMLKHFVVNDWMDHDTMDHVAKLRELEKNEAGVELEAVKQSAEKVGGLMAKVEELKTVGME